MARVNLTEGTIGYEPVGAGWARGFIGGKGLGAAYLFAELETGINPLAPDNKLLFMLGPLTGVAPGMSRYAIVTKSPLTGAFLDTYAGGHFPAELRFALPDCMGIIVEGRSSDMVYLRVENGEVAIEPGEHLRAKTTAEVERLFGGYKVASIGPAGENLVRFACVTNDTGRNAGRGGAGAVMGSKNLKAIVARGKGPALLDGIRKLQRKHNQRLASGDPAVEWLGRAGTTTLVQMCNEAGILPTENWTRGGFEGAAGIDADAMLANLESRSSCYLCPVACHMNTKARAGPFAGATSLGPEYETLALAGSNTRVSDLGAVIRFNSLCDALGLDTISTGAVVAFAMECSRRGWIGDNIPFGDGAALVDLAGRIARREGIGDVLAEGVARAARRIGGGCGCAAVHVKGMEVPGYDPRGTWGMALAYATSDRGACHLRAWPVGRDAFGKENPFTTEGKADVVIAEQNENSAEWCLIGCDFAAYPARDAAEFLSTVIGYDVSEEEYVKIGERVYNLTRLFNVREGFGRKDDIMPARFEKPLPSGRAIKREDFEKMLDEYYKKRGWAGDGVPTKQTVRRLGLDNLIVGVG